MDKTILSLRRLTSLVRPKSFRNLTLLPLLHAKNRRTRGERAWPGTSRPEQAHRGSVNRERKCGDTGPVRDSFHFTSPAAFQARPCFHESFFQLLFELPCLRAFLPGIALVLNNSTILLSYSFKSGIGLPDLLVLNWFS